MDYKILEPTQAHELKRKCDSAFLMNIEFNFCAVYELSDSSFLIMPLNPFGKSLLVKDKNLLNKWIEQEKFPVDDGGNTILNEKQAEINNLLDCKEELKNDLIRYVYTDAKTLDVMSAAEIDIVYKVLKKRRRFQAFKLNFITLVGDFIINHCKEQGYRWGLLEIKQLLNPIKCLVLISNEENGRYFNLEEKVSGKRGYLGFNYILKIAENHTSKLTELEKIVKVF